VLVRATRRRRTKPIQKTLQRLKEKHFAGDFAPNLIRANEPNPRERTQSQRAHIPTILIKEEPAHQRRAGVIARDRRAG
jgi:hypothetical protein